MVDITLSQNQIASGNSTNLSNSTLVTNFNVSPYYDDYDVNDQYYRILYKPGYAVQARELTQMQSMIQSQISRFGRHVFKEGSIVLPGAFTIRAATNGTLDKGPGNPLDYVKISTVDNTNTTINIENFVNKTIRGTTSNISAYIVDVLPSDGTTSNTNTLYVTYLSAQPGNPSIRSFQEGEILTANDVGTAIVMTSANTSNVTGKASWFQIEEGVFFAKDHFICFPTQSVVLDRYGSLPTCKVGFYVTEEIINYTQDTKLLDPALEASNYSAPGADRLRLVSQLEVVPIDDTLGTPDFIPLFTIIEGIIQTLNERTSYNILGDVLAARTNDEAGDYVLKGLNTKISEHLRITSPIPNYGRYPSDGNPAGNSQLLVATVDPGLGYVQGYGITKFDSTDVTFEKQTSYNNVSQQLSFTNMGQYLKVNEFVGTWELNKGNRIQFYDIPQKRISNNNITIGQKWSGGSQSGNNIGSGILNSIQYVTGTPGYDAVYNIYMSDIKMNGSNSFSNVASLYRSTSPYASAGCDVLGSGITSTNNTAFGGLTQATLLYYVGNDAIRTVKDTSDQPKTIYYSNRTAGIASPINMSIGGIVTPALSLGTNQELPYGTTTLSGAADISEINDFTVTMGATFNIGPLTGTVSASGNVLTGANTYFTRFNVGDKIEIAGQANTWYIKTIANNTTLTVSNTVSSSVTGNAIFKAYKAGDIVNMTGVGVTSGTQRSIDTTPTSFTVDIKETLPSTKDVTISYKIGSTETIQASKVLKPSRYVLINCSSAGTNGPFCLGFSDVYAINSITLKNGSAPTSVGDGTDVTKYFKLDNGQRDTMYDLANIVKSSGLTVTNTDYLLINIDYFEPNFSGAGAFFTIDSYPINDTANTLSSEIRTEDVQIYISPVTGFKYDLRNHIDFRPVKVITASDSITVGGASTNPSNNSTSYAYTGVGINFPVPDTQLVYDYSYYLKRIDIVCANKEGTISVIKGTVSDEPTIPVTPAGQMLIAVINITPYPSLSPAYANVLKRKDLSCIVKKASNRGYTMRDIGVLDNRITNLEYYTSLTLLEKNAVNLSLPDTNGINRFKNGIFVDTFKDSSLSAAGTDPDYRIVTDPLELSIRPLFSTESITYDYISGDSNIKHANNDIVLMDYNEVTQFEQKRVTDTRLLEKGTFLFQGNMSLIPSQDVWVDTTQLPDEKIDITSNDSDLGINITGPDVTNDVVSIKKNLINTVWANWQSTVTGYNLYRGDGAGKSFVGTFKTAAEAQAAASWTSQSGGGTAVLETLYNNSRIGTDTFANYSTDQGAGSNKLISTESIPYIRPQKITVFCGGLKAYSKMQCFFDGVNMTQYCTPLTNDQFTAYASGGVLPDIDGIFPTEGDDLIVDEKMLLRFILRIPSTPGAPKFRTGQRKIVVVDNTNINAQTLDATEDSSTTASQMFYAQGTAETLQRTVYSTHGYTETHGTETQSFNSQTEQVLPNTFARFTKADYIAGRIDWVTLDYQTGSYVPTHCCFNPEAKVLMADYTWKSIKDVNKGDKVIGDNGTINTVISHNTIGVGNRKMLKFKDSEFYTTDDHLFLTKKGWKTWRPDVVIENSKLVLGNTGQSPTTSRFLIGDNRTQPIDDNDFIKKITIVDKKIIEEYIPYNTVKVDSHDFDYHYEVHDLMLDGNMTYIVEGYVVHNCCVAYSVMIRVPDDEEGIFCTGFNFYVARKSSTRGLSVSLRTLDNAGQVTSIPVPGTAVAFVNSDIPISNTGGDNPVQARFTSPVFLFNKTAYAFCVHSDSPNPYDVDPDTQIWISRLGQVDKITGSTVNNREVTGQMWQTVNNINWYEIPDTDLTMEIFRANFEKGTGQFIIGERPLEKLHLSNQSQSFKNLIGEDFTSGDIITLTGIVGTIAANNIIKGNISLSNANSSVISISNNQYQMSNSRYVVGEGVISYNANNYVVATANISAIANATAVLSHVDESLINVYAEFSESSGLFKSNQVIKLVGSGGSDYTANVDSIQNFNYSAVSFNPKILEFVKTGINYEMDTYDVGQISSSGYVPIENGITTYLNSEKQIYSRSNEINNINSDRSNKIKITFSNISNYVSPVFDLNYSQNIIIDNIINANTYGEGIVYDGSGNIDSLYSGNTAASGGQSYNKYISQTITLSDGQDAEDLQVIMACYRPPGTDVIVYAKFMNGQDSDIFANKNWIRMNKKDNGDDTYSSLSNRNNFKDFTYVMPSDIMTSINNGIQYTDSVGNIFTSFKYFAIKIVLVADTPAIVPRASELRVIALQI